MQALKKEAGSHTAALRLELRALQGAGRYAEIPALVDQLVKRKVYGPQEGDYLRAAAHARGASHAVERSGEPAHLLEQALGRRAAPAEDRPSRVRRASPRWAVIARRRTFCCAAWSGTGSPISSRNMPNAGRPTPTRQLERGRAVARRRTITTRCCCDALGTLCVRAQLWGKAQTYFEASLAPRRCVRNARGAGRALRAPWPHRRGECAARGGAEARARRSFGALGRVRSNRQW